MSDSLDLEAELDELYATPPPSFVARRSDLAKSLRSAGRREDALSVQALRRPSDAAWAVNALRLRDHPTLASLIESGIAMREALASGGGPEAQLPARDRRRQALAEATASAVEVLEEAGLTPSEATTRRVGRTLEAIAAYGDSPPGRRLGRLDKDLEPPGFESLAGLDLPQVTPKPAASGRRPGQVRSGRPPGSASKRARHPKPARHSGAAPPTDGTKVAPLRRSATGSDPRQLRAARTAATRAEKKLARAETVLDRAQQALETARQELESRREAVARLRRDRHRAQRDRDLAAKALASLEAKREDVRTPGLDPDGDRSS